MIIDPKKTLTVVAAYPDGKMDPSLFGFMQDCGLLFDKDHFAIANIRDTVVCKNRIVQDILLPSLLDTFIVLDNDIGLNTKESAPFLDAPEDLVCIECNTGNESWRSPTAFHAGMWRTRRDVLEAIVPPWFRIVYNNTGTKIVKCLCMYFAEKVQLAGFTVGHAGFAYHKP